MAKKVNKLTDEIRSIRALDIVMRTIGIELYVDGTLTYEDEDNDTIEPVLIDGLACKYPGYPVNPNTELCLDVYMNPKLATRVFLYYISKKGYQINMMYLTNSRPDNLGRFEVEFGNGVKYTSHVYKKDSLKYIDMILALEDVFPTEYAELKELDIE